MQLGTDLLPLVVSHPELSCQHVLVDVDLLAPLLHGLATQHASVVPHLKWSEPVWGGVVEYGVVEYGMSIG